MLGCQVIAILDNYVFHRRGLVHRHCSLVPSLAWLYVVWYMVLVTLVIYGLTKTCKALWSILAGGDHGKGAWLGHIKIFFCSPKLLHGQGILDKKDKRKQPYVMHQIALMCKKLHPKVMESTVSKALKTLVRSKNLSLFFWWSTRQLIVLVV
jgi:hypothetical protein